LRQAYAVLAEKTFSTRSRAYLSQLAEKHYFRYSGVKFWEDGWFADGKKRFEVKNCSTGRYPFYLAFSETAKTKPGFFQRFSSGPPEIRVKTSTDEDVFFAMLQKLYGLSWNK
jgi:hypothetical protein